MQFLYPAMPTSPTILVTGGNKGIGHEICRQLARRGARVFLGARDAGRGEAAVAQINKENPSASVEFLLLDVASTASIDEAAAALGARIQSLDVLINNAGVLADRDGTILATDLALLRHTLETNALGPLYLTQKLVPLLSAASGGARIINVSSGLGQLHDMADEYPSYSISKTALNAITLQFADALKSRNIAVNTISPGWVRTEMGGDGASLSVEEGADTPVWLATEAPLSLTGQFLRARQPIPW